MYAVYELDGMYSFSSYYFTPGTYSSFPYSLCCINMLKTQIAGMVLNYVAKTYISSILTVLYLFNFKSNLQFSF